VILLVIFLIYSLLLLVVSVSCLRELITNNILRLYNDAVNWYLASLSNFDYVSDNNFSGKNLRFLAVSIDKNLIIILLLYFELLKSLFFEVIVSRSEDDKDEDRKENRGSFYPSF
jgi:hypothetical protein